MPDYIWEQLGKLLEMQIALIQEIQEFDEHNKKIREQIEKQHFPDE